MAFPTITRTTWTDAPPDASATVINNAELQLIYDKIDDLVKRIVTVRKNSAGTQFNRGMLNFIEGSNVTLTVADDTSNQEVDITIAAAGGDTAFDITVTSVAVDLNTIASTTIINVTEVGRLGTIGLLVTNAIGDACAATLDITIDGGTKRSFTIYNASTGWATGSLLPWSSVVADGGVNISEHLSIPFNFNYASVLLIAVDVTEAAAASDELTVKVIKGLAL